MLYIYLLINGYKYSKTLYKGGAYCLDNDHIRLCKIYAESSSLVRSSKSSLDALCSML